MASICKPVMECVSHNYLQKIINGASCEFHFFFHFYFFHILHKKIGIKKIFNLRFLTDLQVLGCPEQDFTNFTKCLSVIETDFVTTLAQKLINGMVRYCIFSCRLNINWC